MKLWRYRSISCLIAILIVVLAVQNVPAASDTWDDGGGDDLWSNDANWITAAPGATSGTTNPDTATFTNTGVGPVTVDAGRNIFGIDFNAPNTGYTLSGGSLVLTTGGLIQTSGGGSIHTDTISTGITLAGDASFATNSTTAGRILSLGAVTGSSTQNSILTLAGTGTSNTNAVTGIIANGTGFTTAIAKNGAGAWTLSGANTYTGGTTINTGTLSAGNVATNQNLGASTSGVTLAGGTLRVTNTTAANGTFGSRVVNVTGTSTLQGAGSVGGTSQASRMIFNTANTLTGSSALGIQGTGFLDGFGNADGAVVITAAQSYSGTITLSSGGILALETGGSLASGATISIGNNAELSIGNVNVTNNVTVTGGTTSQMSWANSGTGDLQGTLTLNANLVIGNRNWFNGTAQNGKISGVISGTGTLTTNGGGTLTLTGTNTYNNGTTINAGTVSAGNSAAFGTGTVTFTPATSGTVSNSTNVILANNFASSGPAAGTFTASGGTMLLNGNITGTAGLILNPTNKITLAGTNSFGTVESGAGELIVNAGAGGVDITGSTTLGTGNSSAFGGVMAVAGTTTVTVQSGGSLSIVGTTNATPPSSIIGQNAAGTSTLLVNGGTLTVGANQGFILGNNAAGAVGVLTIASGTATINRGTLGGATTGDQRLISMGRDNATATGTINLNGGTLATARQFVRDGSSTAGSGTANFVFGGGTLKALGAQTDWLQSTTATSGGQGGGTVNASALALSSVTTTAVSTIDSNGFAVAINSAISGAGGFNITNSSGTGSVTFGGNNSYLGNTIVNSGTLALSTTGTNNIASSPLISLTTTGATFNVSAVTGAGGFALAGTQTLAGIGTVQGNTSLNAGANLSPGLSPGTLTFANNLDVSLTGTSNSGDLMFELGTSSDLVLLSPGAGALSIGTGTLGFNDFAFTAGGGFGPGTYPLFQTSNSISGTLDGANLSGLISGYSASLQFADGNTDLVLMVVPEPSTFAMLLFGALAMWLTRRKRAL